MTEGPKKMNDALRQVLKRLHYPIEVMLVCVRWYAAYPLSLRQLEEMMAERGVVVDHTTVHRWAIKMLPVLALMLRRRKRPVGLSLRMDETYILVGGQWKYLYRAVDKAGQTIDFLLRAHRDYAAARHFFERAMDLHGVPEKITIDKSGANTAAIEGIRADSGADIEMRQSKYLNNLIEQDHRAVKRMVRPMLGFKSFRCARAVIAGIETMHMIPEEPARRAQRSNLVRSQSALLARILNGNRLPPSLDLMPLSQQNQPTPAPLENGMASPSGPDNLFFAPVWIHQLELSMELGLRPTPDSRGAPIARPVGPSGWGGIFNRFYAGGSTAVRAPALD